VGHRPCLEGLAWIASAEGEVVRAARLLGAAEALRRRIGAGHEPQYRADHARAVDQARAMLGEAGFASALAAGQGMSVEEAIAYATAGATAQEAQPDEARGLLAASLTPREQEVARIVARGLSNREIADALVISERTAANHIEHILRKLGFRTRAQIAK